MPRITVTEAEQKYILKQREAAIKAEKTAQEWKAERAKQAACSHNRTHHSRPNHDSSRDDAWCWINCDDCGKRLGQCYR